MLQPGPINEPNNRFGNELCAVANATQAYGNAWGWADTKCSGMYISMCIVRGELQAAAARAMLMLPQRVSLALISGQFSTPPSRLP